jgi:hypothetical protein
MVFYGKRLTEIKGMFKNKVMEVINKKGLHNLLSEQLPPKKSRVIPDIPKKEKKQQQTSVVAKPEKTQTTQTTVDPQIKELRKYLNNIEFLSPNNERINLKLDNTLYNKVLNNYESWKDVNPNITLLQSLILTLVKDKNYNVSGFNAPETYKDQIDKLLSENIIQRLKGLKNILLEQFNTVSYVVKNGKIQKPSSQGTKQPSTAGQPTGPLLPPKTSTVQTPEIKKPSEIKLKPEERKMIPQNTTTQLLSDNKNIQKIKYYSDRIDTTKTPNYKLCDNLFDNYESEIKLLKKQIEQGLVNPPKGDEPILGEIKSKIKWCYTSSQEKWRFKFKFSQLSSLRDDKIKNSKGEEIDNPFKVNI